MLVMKFGGSSLADAERLRLVADLVVARRERRPCVVLSAMADTTNRLFAAATAARGGDRDGFARELDHVFGHAHGTADLLLRDAAAVHAALQQLRQDVDTLLRGTHLLRELTARTNDAIVAHGERLSTLLMTALLRERGLAAEHIDARRLVRTDNRFGAAWPQRPVMRELAATQLAPLLATGRIVVTEGYVGGTAEGATTTLGRGGSDWSAALLGEALGVDEVQIWTDVEGVLTADPRLVAEARPVPTLSPAEAAELAAFGAKVLHPATIQPAVDAGIPVTVRHSLRPDGAFTTIDPKRETTARHAVAALACRGPITVLTMTSTRMLAATGYLSRLFAAFAELDICVDLVATAEVSVACTVEADAPLDALVARLDGLAHVDIQHDRAIVAAVGEGLRRTPHVLERASRALHPIVPELVSFGGNERNLSFVVRREEMAAAMQKLHGEFFTAPAARAAHGLGGAEAGR